MREMLSVTAAIVGEGLGESVALLTDGRFSGSNTRLNGRPRLSRSQRSADQSGRYATATSSYSMCRKQLLESRSAILKSNSGWRSVKPRAPRYPSGVFAKYAALVSSASDGAITKPR